MMTLKALGEIHLDVDKIVSPNDTFDISDDLGRELIEARAAVPYTSEEGTHHKAANVVVEANEPTQPAPKRSGKGGKSSAADEEL